MGLKLTTDRYQPITSQTQYNPLCHAAHLLTCLFGTCMFKTQINAWSIMLVLLLLCTHLYKQLSRMILS